MLERVLLYVIPVSSLLTPFMNVFRPLLFLFGRFVPKISDAARAAMEADITLEELSNTIKSKAMKDTAPGPDGIPYSVYNKLWEQTGPLILNAGNIVIQKMN